MILKGSQRGHAAQLAAHLMNDRDNEHVELHELRGFVAETDLRSALAEAHAISKGTRCKQFLFSLSLNPPEGERVDIVHFEAAVDMVEKKLGLEDQPRAVVFHEKEGRRHAHAVWSRIDVETMTAKNLPHTKNRLMEVSKELYLQHGWDMPKGMVDRELRNPLNFNRAEWQQAKRVGQDPRMIKAMIKDAWESSDSQQALTSALEEKGFYLARGDRRGVVVVDYQGEVYALSRWAGVKAKDVKARFPEMHRLSSVQERRERISDLMTDTLKRHAQEIKDKHKAVRPALEFKRKQMVERQRADRSALKSTQKQRVERETRQRSAELPSGLGGLWSRLTGAYTKIKEKHEFSAWEAAKRDQMERDTLIAKQMDERQRLQTTARKLRDQRNLEIAEIRRDIADTLLLKQGKLPSTRKNPDNFTKKSGLKSNFEKRSKNLSKRNSPRSEALGRLGTRTRKIDKHDHDLGL